MYGSLLRSPRPRTTVNDGVYHISHLAVFHPGGDYSENRNNDPIYPPGYGE